MIIEHVAILTEDNDKLREYYEKHFNAKSNDLYVKRLVALRATFYISTQGPALN
jgi:hypothetical protein